MKKDNVFWGVVLILAAVYIIINSFGFMPDVSVVRLGVAVICGVVFFKSLAGLEFGGMLFSLAILLILFDDQLGITEITPWPVLMAALLGSIGLNMIFGNRVMGLKKVNMVRQSLKKRTMCREMRSGSAGCLALIKKTFPLIILRKPL